VTVYYAHCIHLYGTKQEERDVELLEKLGFEVLNPNNPGVEVAVTAMKAHYGQGCNVMGLFEELVASCDALAFRALPDGRIPAGVCKEVLHARSLGKPVIELPSNIIGRGVTVEETREYLAEVGQR
jgi:nucleoside 2-deoxyribosyltransferase